MAVFTNFAATLARQPSAALLAPRLNYTVTYSVEHLPLLTILSWIFCCDRLFRKLSNCSLVLIWSSLKYLIRALTGFRIILIWFLNQLRKNISILPLFDNSLNISNKFDKVFCKQTAAKIRGKYLTWIFFVKSLTTFYDFITSIWMVPFFHKFVQLFSSFLASLPEHFQKIILSHNECH